MTFPAEPANPIDSADSSGRAAIVGTGLIGGSIGLALRARGWHVTGRDIDPARAQRALELGAIDAVGDDPSVAITFVATPVRSVAGEARTALARGGVVTDVAGVKAPVVAALSHPRFVGGHPMAGSEQEGVDGADGSLFSGATWVLTPTVTTDPGAYARVRSVIASLGAEVVALPADRHDAAVALISHLPHLLAVTLMGLAADGASEHAAVLRLAAGGFRDMTRVAAGHPDIWLDICAENRDAIVDSLDRLEVALGDLRQVVALGDRPELLMTLERARAARANLTGEVIHPQDLAEVRVPVLDRPGVVAEVTTLLSALGVNIAHLEIAHSPEGGRGVLVVVVPGDSVDLVRTSLTERGYRPSSGPLAGPP